MNIETQLNSIESKKILVIGDVMLDKYIFGESNRLSPEAPVPILRKTRETMVLGGGIKCCKKLGKSAARCFDDERCRK
jgi:bifunctional ADP-heptose synthase (sugar kinase/adenylyltransferase)